MTAGQLATATGLPRERIAPELSKLVRTAELVKADRGYKTPASKASPPASSATPTATPNGHPPRRSRQVPGEDRAPPRARRRAPHPHLIDRAPRPPSPVDHGNDMSPVDADACAPSAGDGSVAGASPTGSERLTTRRPSTVRGDSDSAARDDHDHPAAWSHLAGRRTRSQALSFDRRSTAGQFGESGLVSRLRAFGHAADSTPVVFECAELMWVSGDGGDQELPGTSLQPAAWAEGRRRCRRTVLQRSAVRRPRAPRGCGELRGRALGAGG